MVLRRARRAGGTAAPAPIEIEIEPNDPLSGEPAGGATMPPVSFPGPDETEPGMTTVPQASASWSRRADPTRHGIVHHARASRMLRLRIALVAVMGIALTLLGGRAFDEFVPELLVPPVAVAVTAMVARRWRSGYRVVAGGATLFVGTVAAGVIAGVARGDLLDEVAAGPRRLLTTEWPSPLDPGVIMSVALALGLVTAISADLAGRSRFHVAPLAPIAVGFAATLAVAAPVHPNPWPTAVLTVAAVLLLVARPGDEPMARARHLLAERSLLATIVGLVIAGVVAASAIAWADRANPREVVDADITLALLDPVEQMVALRTAAPDFELFRITDQSALIGPSLPTRWRLSALDQYDGQRWLPAVTLRPIGSRLGMPTPSNPAIAPPIRYRLTIRSDDIDLIPLPGRPLEFDADDDVVIETDEQRTVVRLAEAPRPGMTALVTAEVAPTESAATSASVATRQVDEIAGTFDDAATSMGGDVTIIEQLRTIEATMRDEWLLDDSASGAGQQLALIQRFVNVTNRGNREQFATAFVLLARSLGVDARVATGLLVPPDELATPLVLRSTHAAVWPEVRLDGLGWTAFDPVPPEQAAEDDDDTSPPSQQSPAAAQPPVPEPPEQADEATDQIEEPEADTTGLGSVSVWLTRAAIIGASAIIPVVAAATAILTLKRRRRRRRLRAADPAQRIVGAWANATDSLVDAGLSISPAWTNDRIADRATTVAPSMPHDMRRLAATATAMTFGRTEHSRFFVDDAVATARSVDVAIRSERTRWQRVRWHLSTRSLRAKTRSPVGG